MILRFFKYTAAFLFFPALINANSSILLLTDTFSTNNDTAYTQRNFKIAKDSLEANVIYSSRDSMIFDATNQKVHLYGDAKVDYKNIKLEAAYIIFDWGNKTITAEGALDSTGNPIGDPVFIEDQTYEAKKIIYNYETKKGRINQLITQEGEGYVHGNKVKKEENDQLYVKNAKYTTCDLEDPHFYIAISKLKVIPDKKIISGPAILKVEDVPTPIFLPFGWFPIHKGRTSGILLPEYGESEDRGFFLDNGGYYFALNDYIDLTVRGGIYSRGSWKAMANGRYNVLYRYRGEATISFSEFRNGDPITPDFSKEKDFLVTWSHTQDSKARPNSMFSANVKFGTNQFQKLNNYNPDEVLANTYQSSISYAWHKNIYNFNIGLTHDQNTQTKIINVGLPSVGLGVNTFNPLKRREQIGVTRWYENINTSYSMQAINKISEKDSLLFREETLKKMQNGMSHSIPVSTNFKVLKYFNLTPFFQYNEIWYLQTIRRNWDEIQNAEGTADSGYVKTDTIREFSATRFFDTRLSLSTFLYGMYSFKKGKIKAIRHVINPALSFSFRPDFSSHSWNYYRQYQIDSIGHTDRYSIYELGIYSGPPMGKVAAIGLNIGNILEMKIFSKKDTATNTKKIKILEALNIGSSYNFAADSLNLSDFIIGGRTTLFEKLGITFAANYSPYVINENNVKQNHFEWNEYSRLARFTNATLNVNATLNSPKKQNRSAEEENRYDAMDMAKYDEIYDRFSLPWNVNFNYGLSMNRRYNYQKILKDTLVQSLSFTLTLSPTPKWKMNISSGYDFFNRKFTYALIDITRDLHCWEMKFNWVPIGFVRYSVQINVKSTMLSDLKLTKKKNWGGYY